MFSLANYPAKSRELFHLGAPLWPAAVAAAVEAGNRKTDSLTDPVFFMHHKERMNGSTGRAIDKAGPGAATLIDEWKGFRTLVAPMVPAVTPTVTPTPAVRGVRTVGAWCGSTTLADPQRDVDFAVANHINRLDIVVNDHAAARAAIPFTLRSVESIRTLCRVAQRAGIETHLMS